MQLSVCGHPFVLCLTCLNVVLSWWRNRANPTRFWVHLNAMITVNREREQERLRHSNTRTAGRFCVLRSGADACSKASAAPERWTPTSKSLLRHEGSIRDCFRRLSAVWRQHCWIDAAKRRQRQQAGKRKTKGRVGQSFFFSFSVNRAST